MTNTPVEHEPIADQSNTSLSPAALEFATILGSALAQQWIQEQAEVSHSTPPRESDVSRDFEGQLTRSE